MSERPPVERVTRYVTTVPTMEEAFAFVMTSIDRVDTLLSVQIRAVWSTADDHEKGRFSATVEGMTELPPYEPELLNYQEVTPPSP